VNVVTSWSLDQRSFRERIQPDDVNSKDWPLQPQVTLDNLTESSPEFHNLVMTEDESHPSRHPHASSVWWTPEILSLLLSIGSIVMIIVVLAQADGKPPPEWPLGTTLNTFLAFFTSLAKFAFMIPVAEGLGQLKWMWFAAPRPRPLSDFQTFDDASRGAFGSLKLLVRFKGVLACLAAIITLSGFFTSTVTQQAVVYSSRLAESANGTASIARATTFSLYDGNQLVIRPHDTTREKEALVNGAFYVAEEEFPPVAPTCSSGDCKWPSYGSLAICSEAANLTAVGNSTVLTDLRNITSQRALEAFNSTLSMVLNLQFKVATVPAAFPLILGPMPYPSGALNSSVTELLFSDSYLAYTDTLVQNVSAFDISDVKFLELGFHWCTKTYSTEVTKGIPITTELSKSAKVIRSSNEMLNYPGNHDFYQCYLSGTCNKTLGGEQVELAAAPGANETNVRYVIDVWTSLISSALLFASMYDAVLTDGLRGLISSSGGGVGQAFTASLFGEILTFVTPDPESQLQNVTKIARNMATSMTNL